MLNINNDLTLKRNYWQGYRLLIRGHGQVKAGTHAMFKRAKEFYSAPPSPSGVHNMLRRDNRNRLKPADKEVKRKIIKERMG